MAQDLDFGYLAVKFFGEFRRLALVLRRRRRRHVNVSMTSARLRVAVNDEATIGNLFHR